jgi:hypothetical protein
MNIITVDIYHGDWKVEEATVSLVDDKIHDVKLSGNDYLPVNVLVIEAQRSFWTEEYKRLGWNFTQKETIARAIGMELIHKNEQHLAEDFWLESAFEDRMDMAGFLF